MWLPWEWGLGLAGAAFAMSAVVTAPRWLRQISREVGIIAVLYALWLRAGELNPFGTQGGLERGRRIRDVQRALHFLDEATVQRWVLPHKWLVQFSNLYYAGVHVPAIGVLLVWLWVRHREQYTIMRTSLALVTAAGLVVRYVPVAPPRMYPELGYVDTGLLYGQSVYGRLGTGVSAQMAAMPSIHVAWAALVGLAGWRVGRGGWRWLGPAHTVLTVLVVTDTANHWWLDSLAGAALVVPALWIARRAASRATRRAGSVSDLESPNRLRSGSDQAVGNRP